LAGVKVDIMEEVKYIGFYDLNDSEAKRDCSLAAKNKMDYIASSINRAGFAVNIISPSWMTKESKIKWEKQREVKIDDKLKVTVCPSFKSNCKTTSVLKVILSLVWLFLYLIFNTKKNEKVIVYHVPWISVPIRLSKFFKRYDLILEVEEIYSDVMIVNSIFSEWEIKLIDAADSYLLSTDLLKDKLKTKKQCIVIYGIYDVKEQLVKPHSDNKIHIVYAGIIDSNKKGAFNALESSKFLSEKYILHIIGFGETEKLIKRIEELNSTNSCIVKYDGILYDDDYIKFCQLCHIGLSTQTMNGKYIESSFPSKILSYLSMGLHVVSCKITCVVKSKIGNLITYYCEDSPESIANAIKRVSLTNYYDSRKKIKELDDEFVLNIQNLLRGELK
jgi:hypothetical protein